MYLLAIFAQHKKRLKAVILEDVNPTLPTFSSSLVKTKLRPDLNELSLKHTKLTLSFIIFKLDFT